MSHSPSLAFGPEWMRSKPSRTGPAAAAAANQAAAAAAAGPPAKPKFSWSAVSQGHAPAVHTGPHPLAKSRLHDHSHGLNNGGDHPSPGRSMMGTDGASGPVSSLHTTHTPPPEIPRNRNGRKYSKDELLQVWHLMEATGKLPPSPPASFPCILTRPKGKNNIQIEDGPDGKSHKERPKYYSKVLLPPELDKAAQKIEPDEPQSATDKSESRDGHAGDQDHPLQLPSFLDQSPQQPSSSFMSSQPSGLSGFDLPNINTLSFPDPMLSLGFSSAGPLSNGTSASTTSAPWGPFGNGPLSSTGLPVDFMSPTASSPFLPQLFAAANSPTHALHQQQVMRERSQQPGIDLFGPMPGLDGSYRSPLVNKQPVMDPVMGSSPMMQNFNVLAKPIMQMPANIFWYYKDYSGNEQGPFNAGMMQEWYINNYFTPELLLRRAEEQSFITLKDFVGRVGTIEEPFLVPLPQLPPGLPIPSHHMQTSLKDMQLEKLDAELEFMTAGMQQKMDGMALNEIHEPVPETPKDTVELATGAGNTTAPTAAPTLEQAATTLAEEPRAAPTAREFVDPAIISAKTSSKPVPKPAEPQPSVWGSVPAPEKSSVPSEAWPLLEEQVLKGEQELLAVKEAERAPEKSENAKPTGKISKAEKRKAAAEAEAAAAKKALEDEAEKKVKAQPFPASRSNTVTLTTNKEAAAAAAAAAAATEEDAPRETAPVAPWAEVKATKPISLKEIEEREAKAKALRDKQQQQERAQQQRLQREAAAALAAKQSAATVGLPRTATWAKPGAGESPITLAAATTTTVKKLSVQDIQREEEAKKAKAAAAAQTIGTGSIASPSFLAAGIRGYANVTSAARPAVRPVKAAAPVPSQSPTVGDAWTVVGAKKTAAPVPAPVVAKPKVVTQPAPKGANGILKPSFSSDEYLKWCRSMLKGVNSGVNQEELLQMLLLLPLTPISETLEIIADIIYANSATMDGRRFAEEFVKRRKVVEAQEKAASSPAIVTPSASAWSEVGKVGVNKTPAKPAVQPVDLSKTGFKVVASKKNKKK
ncbi:uncharacterized protein V1510DRAFT_423660 [Dipodascopsis tothii]|uniref:uncharacterized protein n=1 Tax=Dipodascopsis tothii TaxID=44089 RepID=UPI0034CF6BC2